MKGESATKQELVVKANIHVHSHKIQNAFGDTADHMMYACNLLSKCLFAELPYVENMLKWYGSDKSPLSRVFWSDHLYHLIRDKSDLRAQETTDCFTIVLGKYKTIKKQMKQHKIIYYNKKTGKHYYPTKLTRLKHRVKFKSPWVYMTRGRSWSFTYNRAGHPVLSLGTMYGRIKLPYKIPPYFKQYIKPSTKYGGLQLLHAYPSKHYKRGRWTVHICVSVPVKPLIHIYIRHIVGSDRGIDNVVWTYDDKNKTFHVSGKDIIRRRTHYKHFRAQLEKCHSHSAHRKIKYISHKENRWRQNVNFNILKTLHKRYPSLTVFGLEDLASIRRVLKRVHRGRRYVQVSWAFYDLETKWVYKARLNQSKVVEVDAYNTSKRCPKGHEICGANRHHEHHTYYCKKHHFKVNDDMVGGINIFDLIDMIYRGIENPTFRMDRRGKQ